MARFSEVFAEQAEKPAALKTKTKKIQFIHYSRLVESAYQYRDRNRDMILSLADLIKADGEILEPCIVRKAGAGSDSFELIAGHKRTLAAKYLVEEEKMEEFAFLPCIEKSFSDIRAEFAVYSTNGYDEKTPYEIMREIEGMTRLLKKYPEEFPEFSGKGRMVEKLAEKMNLSRSVVSDYQNISRNLGKKGMQSFQEGKIDKSAAVALASLPEQKQEEILDRGLTRRRDIKNYAVKQKTEAESFSTNTPTEEPIFNLTVGELIAQTGIKSGTIKISSAEKSAVWKFEREGKQFIAVKEGAESQKEPLPRQMNVEKFL